MENKIIGLKELRQHTQKYISRIQRGESFLVVRRSKPVFKVAPPDEEELWEPVVDFTKIQKGGILLKDVLSRL